MNTPKKPATTKPESSADTTPPAARAPVDAAALGAPDAAPPVAPRPAHLRISDAKKAALAGIRDSLAEQAQVQTRFDPTRYRRKQFDAAGNPLPPPER